MDESNSVPVETDITSEVTTTQVLDGCPDVSPTKETAASSSEGSNAIQQAIHKIQMIQSASLAAVQANAVRCSSAGGGVAINTNLNPGTRPQGIRIQSGNQVRYVTLQDLANLRGSMGARATLNLAGAQTTPVGTNQSIQLIGTSQGQHIVGAAQGAQVVRTIQSTVIGSNQTFQLVGASQGSKVTGTGQGTQVINIRPGTQVVGSNQAVQFVTNNQGTQIVGTGQGARLPIAAPGTQLVRVSGTNQFVQLPVGLKSNLGNIVIGNKILQCAVSSQNSITSVGTLANVATKLVVQTGSSANTNIITRPVAIQSPSARPAIASTVQPGRGVTLQVLRPAGSTQMMTSGTGTIATTQGTPLLRPAGAMQQKKIIVFANSQNNSTSSVDGTTTAVNNNANALSLNRGNCLPLTIVGNPASGAGNIQYLVRGGMPASVLTNNPNQTGQLRGVTSTLNVTASQAQAILQRPGTNPPTTMKLNIQTPVRDVQGLLQKFRETQLQQKMTSQTGSPIKTGTPSSSQQMLIVQSNSQQMANLKSGGGLQVIDQRASGSQGHMIYIITNSQAGSNLTAISGGIRQPLTNTKMVTSSAVIRPKILAVRPGGGAVQLITSDPKGIRTAMPRFVDGKLVVTTSKAAQNQKKANRIIEEAIAKAQAEGIEIETSETDGKRKWKRKGEMEDEDGEPVKKRKREPKPRAPRPGKKAKNKGEDGLIGDELLEYGSEDCEGSMVGGNGERVPRSKSRPPKKKKRLPTFMKKRKKKVAESDASDVDLVTNTPADNTFDGIDQSLLQSTRRSSRVVHRKKYVDEIDLGISDNSSNDDEPKNPIKVSSHHQVNAPIVQPEFYEDLPADEDSQIVEKILGMRIGKRTIKDTVTAVRGTVENVEDDMDIDIMSNEDKKIELDRKSGGNSIVVDVEEFYVKYKNYSYLHCAWKTADELLAGDKRIPMKIKRFKIKRSYGSYFPEDEDELFNPEYAEVERVLDVATTVEPGTEEVVTHYLVTWRSLSYEEATWELEQDVDQSKIDAFYERKEFPCEELTRYKPRPFSREWKSLDESPMYKNNNTLREYQLEGLNWLTFSYYNKQNCILADEMGLGKTIQSISFLHQVFDYGIRGPFLIIVPLSTVGNWQREFEAWTNLNVIVYHGSQGSRNMLKQYEMYYMNDKGEKIPDLYKFHALITTYECVISDFDELSQIEWRVAVIDEAHRLKNRNCKLLQGLTCFDLEHRVLLTGTPLQNNVDELFSLLSFLEPKQFSSLEAFMAEFGKLETDTQVEKLKALLKPMMLRRLKEDVEKNLAPKEETIVEVELTNIQKKYYRAILERNFFFLAKGSNSANIPNLMNTMMELRKCCNHPYLVNGAEEQILEELQVGRGETEKLAQAMIQSSGKLVLVDKLLPKLRASGHKVLIFSQMIRVLDIIEDYLIHKQYLYERIDGRIRGNLRQEAIDRFCKPESDRFVFLLCTRAGGLGINLTAADTVIIFDSDWNPQNDLQAQARCHRIGQLKSVKVYRLITRNTYEREMFDRASLKLGLDKAVLQSMGNKDMNVQGQLTKKEIEDLLKKGAYGALMEDDNAGEEFCEEDIEQILQRRTQVIQIEAGVKGSTFAKASFNLTTNRSDIDIDDPNFWQKWAKRVDIDVDEMMNKNDLIMDLPRQRKVTARYGKQDNIVNMSDLDSSNSDTDDPENEGGAKKPGRRKKRHGKWAKDEGKVKSYSRSDCFKVEKNLLVYGWGRWKDILQHGRFKHKLGAEDIITITRAMLMFSLQHYEGDDKIKKFIFDLISPTEDGKEKDYKNHSGLSAPVPRGRKGKKMKKDILKKAQFEDDLTKLDIDINAILTDEGYKKHLKRQSNKVLLRVRLLYYLKQEVIGRQADKILSGAPVSEIAVPVMCADMDSPTFWWDAEADKSLLVGVFKHGYEKYNQIRQDPNLCFLSRCGPPDDKALLAEQNDDDEMKDEEEEEEPQPKRRGRKKKKHRHKDKTKKTFSMGIDDDEEDVGYDYKKQKNTDMSAATAENGKLPFPSASDLNTRFRRIITSFQRCHKQGMLKLEQVAKKMHKREHMRDLKEGEPVDQYVSPTHLKSMHLESVGDNPMRLAEQLNWTRREESDFYRVVSTYGVERDLGTGQFIWDTFRTLGRLDRKHDDTLTEYFKAFYHMCMRVCRRFQTEEESRPPNGMYVMSITEERANRCLARIDLLNKIREQILFHPRLDEHLSLCQMSSYLPDWWICGPHDKDLLIGSAKHGLSRTDYHIQMDPHLSFCKIAKQFVEEGDVVKDETIPAGSNETSPQGGEKVNSGYSQPKKEIKTDADDGANDETDTDRKPSDKMKVKSESLKSEETSVDDKESGKEKYDPVKEELDFEDKEGNPGPLGPLGEDDPNLSGPRVNNRWPKDRLIFHRLENICHCVEMGRWRASHRHHHYATSQDGSMGQSLPSTPLGGGGHDYSIVDEQMEGLKFKLQKRRHRRTKAEIEAEKLKKSHGGSDTEMAASSVSGENLIEDDFGSKHHRARFDPSKLDLEDLTGEENVTVINRNTGKRITGVKAPILMNLADWLIRNPGFDVDSKWSNIVKELHDFPEELYHRVLSPPSELMSSPEKIPDIRQSNMYRLDYQARLAGASMQDSQLSTDHSQNDNSEAYSSHRPNMGLLRHAVKRAHSPLSRDDSTSESREDFSSPIKTLSNIVSSGSFYSNFDQNSFAPMSQADSSFALDMRDTDSEVDDLDTEYGESESYGRYGKPNRPRDTNSRTDFNNCVVDESKNGPHDSTDSDSDEDQSDD